MPEAVREWITDPHLPERQVGWVTQAPTAFVRPVRRLAVRFLKADGTWGIGVLICSLSNLQILQVAGRPAEEATDDHAILGATLALYDQRGGGVETSFKGDKGLGLTKRNKKRFEAQYMLVLLGSLAHNVVIWARRWLAIAEGSHCGMLRMVRDVFHISGLLRFDPFSQVSEIVLNQHARRAHVLIRPLRELLAPLSVVVTLGET